MALVSKLLIEYHDDGDGRYEIEMIASDVAEISTLLIAAMRRDDRIEMALTVAFAVYDSAGISKAFNQVKLPPDAASKPKN